MFDKKQVYGPDNAEDAIKHIDGLGWFGNSKDALKKVVGKDSEKITLRAVCDWHATSYKFMTVRGDYKYFCPEGGTR